MMAFAMVKSLSCQLDEERRCQPRSAPYGDTCWLYNLDEYALGSVRPVALDTVVGVSFGYSLPLVGCRNFPGNL